MRLLVLLIALALTSCVTTGKENKYPGYDYAGSFASTESFSKSAITGSASTIYDIFYRSSDGVHADDVVIEMRNRMKRRWKWNCYNVDKMEREYVVNSIDDDYATQKFVDILAKSDLVPSPAYKAITKFDSCSTSTLKYILSMKPLIHNQEEYSTNTISDVSEFKYEIKENVFTSIYAGIDVEINAGLQYITDKDIEFKYNGMSLLEKHLVFVDDVTNPTESVIITMLKCKNRTLEGIASDEEHVILKTIREIGTRTYMKKVKVFSGNSFLVRELRKMGMQIDRQILGNTYTTPLGNSDTAQIVIGYYQLVPRDRLAGIFDNKITKRERLLIGNLEKKSDSMFTITK